MYVNALVSALNG